MQQADLMGFFKTILIILLIYYGLKFIMRLAFPVMVKKFMGKMEQKVKQQQQSHTSQQQGKVGETTIDSAPRTKKSNKDVGEYVDYEEID